MNYEEIAAMLAAGKSADEIAKEFTDALNKAAAEQKAAEEAKAKNAAKDEKLNEIAQAISFALNEYAVVAGISDVKLTRADVRKMLDEFLPVVESIKDIKVHVAKVDPKKVSKKHPEDIFNWFFKEMNI